VVELGRRLVVPRAPRLAAVDRDAGALVSGQQDGPWVVGVDPDRVRVVAAGGTLERCKGLAAVGRFICARVRHVEYVLVFRITPDLGEVGTTAVQSWLAVDEGPALARVVGAVDAAALARVHHRVQALRIAWRDGNTDAAQPLIGGRQPPGQRLPGRA